MTPEREEFAKVVAQLISVGEEAFEVPPGQEPTEAQELAVEHLNIVTAATTCDMCPRAALRPFLGDMVCGDHTFVSLEEGREAGLAALAILSADGLPEN